MRHCAFLTAEPSPLCDPTHVLFCTMPLWIADARNHNPLIAAMAQIAMALAQDDRLIDWKDAREAQTGAEGRGSEEPP